MGREIKRVKAGFDWPLGKVWDGYLMPENLHPIRCKNCDVSGYNKKTKKLADLFYDRVYGWCHRILQDEVQALCDAGRLRSFTHVFVADEGWVRRQDMYIPTADEVNMAAYRAGVTFYDCVDKYILVETRAKRLGIYGKCPACGGEGEGWRNDAHRVAHDSWEETPVPPGTWWQVWETVSEGSPVTPAFSTDSELVEYLVSTGDLWDQKSGRGGWDRGAAEGLVRDRCAPSMVAETGDDGSTKLIMPRDSAMYSP